MEKEYYNIIIDETATLLQAMQQLDNTAKQILFVVRNSHLVAALTDGDVRRWILQHGDLEAPVSRMANYNPCAVRDENKKDAPKLLKSRDIDAIPIVDADNVIIDIYFRDDRSVSPVYQSMNIPVVIMAGGLGTRLYPYTKILPKPLIPIGEIPITEHIIQLFRKFGCNDFYMIVNHKKNMIKAYFNEIEKEYNLNYLDEDNPLGTGGGVSLLRGKIEHTFILTNCDTLIQEDFTKIVKEHREKKNAITMICSLKNYHIPYGVVEMDNDGCILDMREKPQMSFFTNTGTYIVEPKILELISSDEKISFPEIILRAKKKKWRVGVYPIGERKWLDMGEFDSLEEMRKQIE